MSEAAAGLRTACPVCWHVALAVLQFRDGRPVLVDFICPKGCTPTTSDLAASELAELLPELQDQDQRV